MFRAGVIADTHGFLDPQIIKEFSGVDTILHAGDVGPVSLIAELEKVAVVSVVSGNTDLPGMFPEVARVTLAGKRFLIQHICDPVRFASQDGGTAPAPDIVIYGHTHKPFAAAYHKVLFFNPGYAGKQRFNLPRTIAIIMIRGEAIEWSHITL